MLKIYYEKVYLYYKNLSYSDYNDETISKIELEEINKEKYLLIDLYLNRIYIIQLCN